MSVINSNPFGGAFAPGAGFGEFENGATPMPATPTILQRGDDVAPTPWGFQSGLSGGADAAGAPGGAWSFGSVMNAFMSAVSNLLGQLGSALGTGGTTPAGSAPLPTVPAPAPAPGSPSSGGSSGAESYYTSASAASVGDPHDSFESTGPGGAQSDGRWNDMHAHGDLLDSDSFAGGYRISTSVTQQAANGTTLNESATIATAGGATSVTLNGDGSYSVVANGQNVSLQSGVATSLGNGESVTLNADGSLTVADTNAQGGSIATTLQRNHAGGVDVRASATDVDLGGYLTRGPGGAAAPSTPAPGTAPAPLPAAPNGVVPGTVPYGAAVPPWPTVLSPGAEALDPFGIQAL
jgi:hypothetical protein